MAMMECIIPVDENMTTMKFHLDFAMLWWPNGCSKPYLYHFTFTLLDKDQTIIDRMERTHGIRTIEIRQENL
jgi:beta-galactosidase/beta-glucuronidase